MNLEAAVLEDLRLRTAAVQRTRVQLLMLEEALKLSLGNVKTLYGLDGQPFEIDFGTGEILLKAEDDGG